LTTAIASLQAVTLLPLTIPRGRLTIEIQTDVEQLRGEVTTAIERGHAPLRSFADLESRTLIIVSAVGWTSAAQSTESQAAAGGLRCASTRRWPADGSMIKAFQHQDNT
jgi:hypothetical protein